MASRLLPQRSPEWKFKFSEAGLELNMQTLHKAVKTGEELTRDGTHGHGLRRVSLKGHERTSTFQEKERPSSYHPIVIQTLRARLIFPIYFRIINRTD